MVPALKKYWFPIVGILSFLFVYRFTFTYTFTTATVEGISTEKVLFLNSRSVIVSFRKGTTEIRARYFDDAAFQKGDKVLLIYKEKEVSYFNNGGSRLGIISGSPPLPVFYDSKAILSSPWLWLSNFFSWLFFMGIIALIRKRKSRKLSEELPE